mmetsp:Transcript_149864/g.272818  ORF Transcript_149864/g.272818 Transcript_149864/m.272818 type:complete len:118 (+) Transcript_149864:1809-2162(+)
MLQFTWIVLADEVWDEYILVCGEVESGQVLTKATCPCFGYTIVFAENRRMSMRRRQLDGDVHSALEIIPTARKHSVHTRPLKEDCWLGGTGCDQKCIVRLIDDSGSVLTLPRPIGCQ